LIKNNIEKNQLGKSGKMWIVEIHKSQCLATPKKEDTGDSKGHPRGPITSEKCSSFEPTKRKVTKYVKKQLAGQHS
jgi:hypothetical protein